AVRSGDRVFLGSNVAVPLGLINALARRNEVLHDVELVHILTAAPPEFTEKISPNRFFHKAFFVGHDTRQAVQEGNADYIPIFLSEIPALFKTGEMPVDVAMVNLSMPDRHGFCSYGIGVDICPAAVDSARVVIGQINPNMPRTLGESFVHIDELDYVVYDEHPILELAFPKPDAISKKIGYLVSTLVEDGSTLQMGIGKIPDAALDQLGDRKDLGVHTEMFSDGLLRLVKSGVVTNEKKGFKNGKIVTSFCMGTRELYDFVDDNPYVEFYPSDFTNSPLNIAKNNKMVSINSAIEVDLSGQVCADSMGTQIYSGIGGQVDFIRGAALSNGGKSILALPSTAKGGTISRIKVILSPGAGVVTSRGDVYYVVTEYGIAYLHGKSVRERAIALLSIAHPDFRQSLYDEAIERGILFKKHGSPFNKSTYPIQYEADLNFDDGTRLKLRPILPTDVRLLQEFFYSHDIDTIYHRYFTIKESLPADEALELATVDYKDTMALVLVQKGADESRQFVGVVRYNRPPYSEYADMAIVVDPVVRGKGIGKVLLDKIMEVGRDNGLKGFRGVLQFHNEPMMRLLKQASEGKNSEVSLDDGVYTFQFDI
ncbi:MAG: GNAT family N-acetyltransferase, partial [Proteobacteria bacterium]|nr:GNAT family N-acetyltransferase [Pseudomonadota bacterium]